MMTPYDWQEGIGHRAQYVEGRLKTGIPVVASSVPDGVLVATYRSQTPKIYEIYDRLVFSAIGLQSDVEAIRVAAIEFCHQEGFRRSEEDVTIQRTVNNLTGPLKAAFGNFQAAPVVVRSVFAEVGETVDHDRFYVLDYDGDYTVCKHKGIVAGSEEAMAAMEKALERVDFDTAKTVDALAQMREALVKGMDPSGERAAASELEELTFEAVLMSRSPERSRRFTVIEGPGTDDC